MSTINRFVVCASFVMAGLCLSGAAQAQASFEGTWRTDL